MNRIAAISVRQKRQSMFPCVVALLTLGAGPALASGFQYLEIPGGADMPPIEAAVWYPSAAIVPDEPNTPFGQAVAMYAPVEGTDLPLVVISHGDGGWFGGHAPLAEAMAKAGLIAVAFNHPGNSDGDETAPPSRWITERPRHLARVVDFMSRDWPDSAHVDPTRIGAFGFSAGGHTVLAAAGAKTSMDRIAAHCAATPAEFVCRSGMASDLVDAAGAFPKPLQGLQAVVAAAPGFGFGFDPAQVAGLDVAIQLWAAAEDTRVPQETNTDPLAAVLEAPSEARVVEAAGHFAFRPPCNPALGQANPRVWAMACTDAPGFDREDFQERFTRDVVEFLSENLGVAQR
jgi:predicted dienelactone hydrolase